jgi:ketosteroid isomerase-like protein
VSDKDLTLIRYYAAVDRGDMQAAGDLVHPDVSFAVHLPAGARRGSTRAELMGYLSGRGDVVRRHVPLGMSSDGSLEFVYGAVVEDEDRTTGHFLAAVRLNADGLIAAYHVSFDTELALIQAPAELGARMTGAPVLTTWFATMDSETPDDVLEMITDDFVMSVQFSTGSGTSAEFVGDRSGLVAYLEQREKSVLVHVIDVASTVGATELVLGRTTRDGAFEASFNASAQLVNGRVRRLLIGRTPELRFD